MLPSSQRFLPVRRPTFTADESGTNVEVPPLASRRLAPSLTLLRARGKGGEEAHTGGLCSLFYCVLSFA